MDFLPPENNAVSSLLAVIANPKEAQSRLNNLNKIQSEINTKIEESRNSENAAKQAKADAEKIKAEAEAVRNDVQNNLDKIHKDYQAKMDALNKSWTEHQALKAKELSDIDFRKKEQDAWHNTVVNKENDVKSREIAVTAREKEAEDKNKYLDQKLSKLKEIM